MTILVEEIWFLISTFLSWPSFASLRLVSRTCYHACNTSHSLYPRSVQVHQKDAFDALRRLSHGWQFYINIHSNSQCQKVGRTCQLVKQSPHKLCIHLGHRNQEFNPNWIFKSPFTLYQLESLSLTCCTVNVNVLASLPPSVNHLRLQACDLIGSCDSCDYNGICNGNALCNVNALEINNCRYQQDDENNTNSLYSLIQSINTLDVLNVRNTPITTDILELHPSVKFLTLAYTHSYNNLFLQRLQQHTGSIESLSIIGNQHFDDSFLFFIKTCLCLHTLSLTENEHINLEQINCLFAIYPPTLTTLTIDIGKLDLCQLTSIHQTTYGIRHLRIEADKHPDLCNGFSFLNDNPWIQTIECKINYPDDSQTDPQPNKPKTKIRLNGCIRLAKVSILLRTWSASSCYDFDLRGFQHAPALKILSLRNIRLFDEYKTEHYTNIKLCLPDPVFASPILTHINFEGCGVTNSTGLGHISKLQYLNLSGTRFLPDLRGCMVEELDVSYTLDPGIEILAECPYLHTLHMSHIRHLTFEMLVSLLTRCKRLRWVDVTGCSEDALGAFDHVFMLSMISMISVISVSNDKNEEIDKKKWKRLSSSSFIWIRNI